MAKEVPEDIKRLFNDSVRILREDAMLAQNRTLLERLDRIESQTRREPKTPEEKAAAYDELMARNTGQGRTKDTGGDQQSSGSPQSGKPSPPQEKSQPPESSTQSADWWWGSSDE